MSNRPWMPLYVGDYLADTAHLRAIEHGAYLLLIMHYWRTGGLPDDDLALARITRTSNAEWKRARPIISLFFQDGWKHKRIEFELTEAARISAAGRAGGKASGEARRQRVGNDKRTTDERSFNDPPNDQATNREALHSPSQSPDKQEPSLRSGIAREPFGFEEFWELYPNKVGKADARKAFTRIAKSNAVTFENLMGGLRAYVAKTDDRPWCNPSTWLNQGRWDDQPAEDPKNGKSINAAGKRLLDRLGGVDAAAAYVPGSSGPTPLRMDFGPSEPSVRLLPKG